MLDRDRSRFAPVTAALKNSQTVTLRFLAAEDTQALADFYASLPRTTYRFYGPHALTRDPSNAAAAARSPTHVCLVAEDQACGHIAGYAWYHWESSQSPTSTFGICLREAYRGIGLGQALMERLLHVAAHVGPPRMSLTVQKANPRALALYRKMGFQVVREQMRGPVAEFPPEPEFYMERETRPERR
jgi:ribosomal protein S18 acetylase RimI-like enzyme